VRLQCYRGTGAPRYSLVPSVRPAWYLTLGGHLSKITRSKKQACASAQLAQAPSQTDKVREMTMLSTQAVKRITATLTTVGLTACGTPTIQSIRHNTIPTSPTASPDRKEEIREFNRIVLNRPSSGFTVSGRGTCGAIRILFGDGSSQEVRPADLATGVQVGHTYTGWGGPKKVTAETVSDCFGRTSTEVTVEPTFKAIGIGAAGVTTACNALAGVPPVRKGSRVTVGDASNGQAKINVGGFVERGIDGSPEVALGPPFRFPFPGLKAHSLVLRINDSSGSSQVEQGGEGKSFVARFTGPLELCINDDNLIDNRGAWGVKVEVDERGAEP
jgi:hypothetical protein